MKDYRTALGYFAMTLAICASVWGAATLRDNLSSHKQQNVSMRVLIEEGLYSSEADAAGLRIAEIQSERLQRSIHEAAIKVAPKVATLD